VLGVCGAAAVARQHDLAAGAQAALDACGDIFHRFDERAVFQSRSDDVARLLEVAANQRGG
jgi:hypothetical protein